MRRSRWIVLLSLLVLVSVSAGAEPAPTGREFRVNQVVDFRPVNPVAAFTRSGEALVVWEHPRLGLLGRFYGADGAARGPQVTLVADQVLTTLPAHGEETLRRDPALVMLPSGEFFLFWTDERSEVSLDIFYENRFILDTDVYAQRFTPAGVPVGERFRVHESTTGREGKVRATLQGGGILVTWQESGKLFARRLRRNGAPLGASMAVSGTGTIWNQAVAANATGAFLIVWESEGDGDQQGVFARLFDKDGAPIGGEILVNSETVGRQRRPGVATDKAGNFLVVWQTSFGDLRHTRIVGQKLDSTGGRIGGQLLINQGGPHNLQIAPSVLSLPSGNFLVTWMDWEETFAKAVWGVETDGDGAPVSAEVQLSSGAIYPQYRMALATNAQGRALAVWEGVLGRRPTPSVTARFLEIR